jgi:pterin-4a-carbinolamine dehydratase
MTPIVRKYNFESFEETIAFINRVSKIFTMHMGFEPLFKLWIP